MMASEASTRLDNIENKSDEFYGTVVKVKRKGKEFKMPVSEHVLNVQGRAKHNNEWAKSRTFVNQDTGEVLTDEDGNALSLLSCSRSWYSRKGARNNARAIVHRLAKAMNIKFDEVCRPKFITLTFRDSVAGWFAERAIQKFLDAVRHWAKKQRVEVAPYFWSAEIQERGALHYHLLIFGLPYLPKEQVIKWWPYGFVDIRAVDDTGRAFKYLAKYLWKWGKTWDMVEDLASETDIYGLPAWWFLFSVFSKRRYGFSKWFSFSGFERLPQWLQRDVVEFGLAPVDVVKAGRKEGGGWLLHIRFGDDLVSEIFVDSLYKIVELSASSESR
jgi:hypothetical protein